MSGSPGQRPKSLTVWASHKTGHYSQYFKTELDPETKEVEYTFDWGALKNVHKSFLDSIIVELCFPSSPIPKQILYQLLGEAIEESPKDRKNFSQAVWDAVGDLSVRNAAGNAVSITHTHLNLSRQ